jgi:uncharacterized RDD family membrane protein YckC
VSGATGDELELGAEPAARNGDGRLSSTAHGLAAARAQMAAAARVHRRRETAPAGPPYAGLVTRTIAFALDAAIVNLAALVVAATLALAFSILHLPHAVKDALIAVGGAAFVVWTVGYFATFWSTTGQTPADRLMRIRVRDAEADAPLPAWRAIVRFLGVVLCAIPLGAGFLPILFDGRRRGLHDRLARTVVVTAADEPGG